MITTDTDGVPMRHFPRRIFYEIDSETHGRLRRIHVGIPGNVLLQNIVLRSPTQLPLRDPLLQSSRSIQAEQNRSGRVDCHASADLAEIDSIEQPSHIVDTADSDSDLAHFPVRSWMIRVKAELRWKIEGSAKSSLSMRDQILESPVGFAG